jgi:hypothetical protein
MDLINKKAEMEWNLLSWVPLNQLMSIPGPQKDKKAKNWIKPTQLGPLEGANLNHCPGVENSSFQGNQLSGFLSILAFLSLRPSDWD